MYLDMEAAGLIAGTKEYERKHWRHFLEEAREEGPSEAPSPEAGLRAGPYTDGPPGPRRRCHG